MTRPARCEHCAGPTSLARARSRVWLWCRFCGLPAERQPRPLATAELAGHPLPELPCVRFALPPPPPEEPDEAHEAIPTATARRDATRARAWAGRQPGHMTPDRDA